MKDYLIQALAYGGQVRVYAVSGSEIVTEARKRHQLSDGVTSILGKSLLAGVMLGNMQKDDGAITLKLQGNGSLGFILVHADNKGNVRGYVDSSQVVFDPELSDKEKLTQAIGDNGILSIVKEMNLKHNFSSQIPLVSGDIADNLTYYFYNSEQTRSVVGLGLELKPNNLVTAVGFIGQLLPDASPEVVTKLEEKLKNTEISSMLTNVNITPELVLEKLFGNDLQILHKKAVEFCCFCTRERLNKALIATGAKELRAIQTEDGKAEVHCRFCNEYYQFTYEDLDKLIAMSH